MWQHTEAVLFSTMCGSWLQFSRECQALQAYYLCNIPSTIAGCALLSSPLLRSFFFFEQSGREHKTYTFPIKCESPDTLRLLRMGTKVVRST